MHHSRALALLLALSCAFFGKGFRLRRTGGHDIAADSHPNVEEPSWAHEEVLERNEWKLQEEDVLTSSSEEDKAGEEEEEVQNADGSISSVEEEEEAGQAEPERDVEESISEDDEEVEEEEPEGQDSEKSSFIVEEHVRVTTHASQKELHEARLLLQSLRKVRRTYKSSKYSGGNYAALRKETEMLWKCIYEGCERNKRGWRGRVPARLHDVFLHIWQTTRSKLASLSTSDRKLVKVFVKCHLQHTLNEATYHIWKGEMLESHEMMSVYHSQLDFAKKLFGGLHIKQ